MAATLSSCSWGDPVNIAPSVQHGKASKGAALITQEGCGTCHMIPGISGADGNVGPPLTGIGTRTYVAGMLLNNPKNLERWLEDPQKIVPGNDMPNLKLTHQQARDIAAYLYTLH